MNNTYTIESQRESQKERLRFLIEKYLKLTQQDFSSEINIGQGYISQLLGGKNITSRILLKVINRYPEININWLLTGKGEMLLNNQEGKEMNLSNNNGHVIGNSVTITKSEREVELEKENKLLHDKVEKLQAKIIDLLENRNK